MHRATWLTKKRVHVPRGRQSCVQSWVAATKKDCAGYPSLGLHGEGMYAHERSVCSQWHRLNYLWGVDSGLTKEGTAYPMSLSLRKGAEVSSFSMISRAKP